MKLDKLQPATPIWRENQTPFSADYDDFYFSSEDALAEIDYIFLNHNQLAERFQTEQDFCIIETGFGTGLNFLRSVQLWLNTQKSASAKLHFISFEKHPLQPDDLTKAHAAHPELAEFSQALCQAYPFLLPGWHTLKLFNEQVTLTLWFGDVLQGLPEVTQQADAWFLDGFTPSRNPDMWQPALFTQMARLSHLQTSFATFTSAGKVRRGLEAVGFEVKKASGYSKKREMAYGQLMQPRAFSSKTPWFALPKHDYPEKTAVVVGAGIAGASVAHQLANEGWQVTVIETEKDIATQASGNLAGAIHPLVTSDWNLRSQWYLKGFATTLKWLKPWFKQGKLTGALNGLAQLAIDPKMDKRLQDSLRRVGLPAEFAAWQTAQQMSERIGQQTNYSGLYFPQGGWVQPKTIVESCLEHKNISLETQTQLTNFQQTSTGWQVECESDKQGKKQLKNYQVCLLVIATGGLSETLNQRLNLPIRPVKGQVSHIHDDKIPSLNTTVTHGGYSVSLQSDLHISGATFEAPNMQTDLSLNSQNENLRLAAQGLPEWMKPKDYPLKGKVGFRPTSPDHLPIIGPVANPEFMQQAYLSQNHTHAVHKYPQQTYLPGLYVSNGHGARGLMSAFLAAELISDLVHQRALNLPLALYHASHPARFVIRKWRSGTQNTSKKDVK